MKKLFAICSSFLMLNACATSEETTLRDVLFESSSVENNSEYIDNNGFRIVEIPFDEATPTYQLPKKSERYEAIIPTAEIFAIPAARATNKMLDETRDIYEQNGNVFLFVSGLKKNDRNLPEGTYKAEQVTKKIISGSKTFKVVGNKDEADYILETIVDNIGTTNEPIIEYKLILTDTENKKVKEWTEIIRKLHNDDRSWW
ncbi:MAG: hypothetical protein E7012_04410 [Alphaproteobacteria bacterium]|nr:hypothetical protein [Alphaproteobacteria bacterium]